MFMPRKWGERPAIYGHFVRENDEKLNTYDGILESLDSHSAIETNKNITGWYFKHVCLL